MKALLSVVVLSLGFVLSGCALVAPADLPVSQSLSAPAQAVQKTINESNIAITAAANVVAQNTIDGIWTKQEGQAYIAKLKDYASKVDAAQKMLDSGDVLNAKNQAELLSRLIVALHREVAARARKQ